MVLESIIGEKNIRLHPIYVFFLAVMITAGAIFFANLLFPAHASVLSIAFITIGLAPLIFNVLADEEAEEIVTRRHFSTFFARHFNVIMLYVWIFVGIIVAFALIYAFYPLFNLLGVIASTPFAVFAGQAIPKSCIDLGTCDSQKASLFNEQIVSFCSISGECKNGSPYSISGRASAIASRACLSNVSTIGSCTFFIFENNAGVLIFTVLLSLLYGVGAIFIIAWNASILGIFFGETFLAASYDKLVGMIPAMLVGHGPPELLGYVFGALAGAILSAMVAKGDYSTHGSAIILKDVIFLFVLGLFSVGYGAMMEGLAVISGGDSLLSLLYYSLGFLYLLLIIVAVVVYGRSRSPPKFAA